MSPRRTYLIWLVVLVAVVGCSQRMAQEPRYGPLAPSAQFGDGTSARPLPPDTVARGHLRDDALLFTGKDANGQDSSLFPMAVTREVLERGRQRFDIYCAVCHGYTGDADGMVVQRGFLPPPSYRSEERRVGKEC